MLSTFVHLVHADQFYSDGLSEGQFDVIARQEVGIIKSKSAVLYGSGT